MRFMSVKQKLFNGFDLPSTIAFLSSSRMWIRTSFPNNQASVSRPFGHELNVV